MPTQRTWDASGRAKFIARRTRNGMGRFRMAVYRVRQGMGRFRMVAYRKISGAGRFVLVAPVLPPLAAFVGGALVPVQQNALSYDRHIDDSASGSFTVEDSGAGYDLSENRTVMIFDSQSGITLYRGFIDHVDESLVPGSSTNMRTVTLKDLRWLAEKRTWTGNEFPDWTAGDIAAELHRTVLVNEGISAAYALRHDMDAVSFGAGTLTNVAANAQTGALELAKAGTDFTKTETTTADFTAGTLTNVVGASNQLTLTAYKAIKMSGTAGTNVGVRSGNSRNYWAIWNGSMTINTGDYLEYFLWIASTSAELSGGVDLLCSDGTTLRDSGAIDQYGVSSHPNALLGGWANDQWLYRKIVVPTALVGKTLKTCMVALEGDKDGPYTFYARAIHFKASGGSTRAAIFDTSLQKLSQVSNVGYIAPKVSVVTAYEQTGTRISPSYSIAAPVIAGNSLVTYDVTVPEQPSTTSTQDQPAGFTLETSLDSGNTWQLCTNYAAIPSSIIGMNLAGKSLQFRETLTIAGSNPELSPVLREVTSSLLSAYNATKVDVSRAQTASAMTDGTLTNVGYQTAVDSGDLSGLKLGGYRKNWRTAEFAGGTLFGDNIPARGNSLGNFFLGTFGPGTANYRFDTSAAGTYSSVIAEVDFQAASSSVYTGILYRTTNWDNTDNSFAYIAQASAVALQLGRGSNSAGVNTFAQLANVPITLNAGSWYHLKIVCGSDNIHHIFLDDVEYITITDATFTAAGNVGLRVYYSGTGASNGYFDHFGAGAVSTLTGNRVAPSVSLAAATTLGDSRIWWNADIPTGCTVDVQTSINGGSTYTSATSGAAIPGLTPGQSLSGVSLLVKTILSTGSAGLSPTVFGLGWLVTGQFSTSGQRITPALDITPANTIGASSVAFAGDTPVGTTLAVDSSTDGSTFTPVAISGDPVAGLVAQGPQIWDTFDIDSHTSYTLIPL